MKASHTLRAELEIPLSRKVATEDGFGFTRVPDGRRVGQVVVEIDLPAILENLGRRALRSKGKRSSAMSGLVVAKVVPGTLKEERLTGGKE